MRRTNWILLLLFEALLLGLGTALGETVITRLVEWWDRRKKRRARRKPKKEPK